MKQKLLAQHRQLEGYCQVGAVSLIRQVLSECSEIDLTFDEGTFFYRALDLSDESVSLELLNLLLSYATEHKINRRVVAKTIQEVMDRFRGTIPDSALELLKPHLAILDGSDPGDYSEDVARSVTMDGFVAAAKSGNTALIQEHFDINNRGAKIMLIAIALQNNKLEVIDTLIALAPTMPRKATVLRTAGDMCVKAHKFAEAEEYYNKSLELHKGYYVTYAKLGALYHLWSHDDSATYGLTGGLTKADITTKAIESYQYALDHKPVCVKYESIREGLKTVQRELGHLSEVGHADAFDSISVRTEEISSYFSDDDYDEDVGVIGDIGAVEH